jgi:hypothetical protein
MGERVYLDQNVLMAILKNERPGLMDHIKCFKEDAVVFPYSPAHIEEVAIIPRECEDATLAGERVNENLQLIEEISDRWEYLPALGDVGPSRLAQEDPRECMKRVVDGYDLTLSAEEIERFQMSFKSAAAFEQVQQEFGTNLLAGPGVPLHENIRNDIGIEVKRVSNLTEAMLFADSKVQDGLARKLWNYPSWNLDTLPKGDDLLACHKTREVVVNLVLAYLEEIGYRADDFDKYRSRMHDVSHAIYACAASVFVTGDKRYRQRVKATYHFLQIPTRVLSSDEFLACTSLA